jgi:GNAT superfamily N-acetyltransferase
VLVRIREFQRGDEDAFRRLNEEWIVRYFELEPKDMEALSNPKANILNKGGRIFFAEIEGEAVGCCALLSIARREFEVAKMAVSAAHQGKGIGRCLLQHVIEAARASGANRLFLETNRRMAPALHLYESIGFQHVPPERIPPSPYARSDVSMEMLL